MIRLTIAVAVCLVTATGSAWATPRLLTLNPRAATRDADGSR
jgi:hypothetical protein